MYSMGHQLPGPASTNELISSDDLPFKTIPVEECTTPANIEISNREFTTPGMRWTILYTVYEK